MFIILTSIERPYEPSFRGEGVCRKGGQESPHRKWSLSWVFRNQQNYTNIQMRAFYYQNRDTQNVTPAHLHVLPSPFSLPSLDQLKGVHGPLYIGPISIADTEFK